MMGKAEPAPSFMRFEDLATRLHKIFLKAGTSMEVATILAQNCAACERDGTLSHGVFRIPGYVASLASGWVDGKAEPEIDVVGPSFVRIDGGNGFAQPALVQADKTIRQMLEQTGLTLVALRNSHHFSALWPDLEPWAERGFVALTMVTGGPAVMPFGAGQRLFGTNPIAFATPVAGASPLVFDFSTASMSQGDIRLAAQAGRSIPFGTGLGQGGHPTTDPVEVLDEGGILPFGGHKGAALSLMVEVLASALTGGPLSYEVNWKTHPGAETPRTGQFLLIVDPCRGNISPFAGRVATLLSLLKEAGAERLPADHRYARRKAAEKDGIPLSPSALSYLR